MSAYDPNLTLAEAVKQYFIDNKFGSDGGYSAAWVDLKLGPIPFVIRNTQSRVRAVRFHDLHHVMTGYKTDWAGEFEISAWELATGCADMYAAWWLNLGGLVAGLMFWPQRTVRAFVRGRHSQNLYRREYGPELLGQKVGATQADLGLSDHAAQPKMRVSDGLALAGMTLLGIPVGLVTLTASVAMVPFAIFQNLTRARKSATA